MHNSLFCCLLFWWKQNRVNGKSNTNWSRIYEGNDEFTVNLSTRQLLHADESYRSIRWKIMSDPYFPRFCVTARFNFYDQNAFYTHPISMLTARLLPSPLRAIHDNLVLWVDKDHHREKFGKLSLPVLSLLLFSFLSWLQSQLIGANAHWLSQSSFSWAFGIVHGRTKNDWLLATPSLTPRSLARSSQLVNNQLVCEYVVRTELVHIKNSVWLWGLRHVNFGPATQSFLLLSNHTNKLAYYRCSQCVMYILLTKREVKMAGYWPSSLFAFLWTETKSRSIKT